MLNRVSLGALEELGEHSNARVDLGQILHFFRALLHANSQLMKKSLSIYIFVGLYMTTDNYYFGPVHTIVTKTEEIYAFP